MKHCNSTLEHTAAGTRCSKVDASCKLRQTFLRRRNRARGSGAVSISRILNASEDGVNFWYGKRIGMAKSKRLQWLGV